MLGAFVGFESYIWLRRKGKEWNSEAKTQIDGLNQILDMAVQTSMARGEQKPHSPLMLFEK
jgi:hypothetical protein